MRKRILYSILCTLLITSSVYTHQEKYWETNNKPWYSLVYQTIFGAPLADQIPKLVAEHDQAVIINSSRTIDQQKLSPNILIDNQEYAIEQISCKIATGPTYKALQTILQTMPEYMRNHIQLRYDQYNIFPNVRSITSYIIVNQAYYQYPDAAKLFILHHELQHHLYNDVANNHLEKIINLQSHDVELQEQLAYHKESLQNHILRYIEYRADTQALQTMQCPYCLQEVALVVEDISGEQEEGIYHPEGYLYQWQFQPRINELLDQKTCCQHHINTNKKIDLSIVDESTLLNRLIMIQER